ncbi:hypothetical protein AN644_00215 [Candidatus Epulonipiscium fishelsonii]|nr:hypothetical protein AN644_00215 [Epulopiscium sp. SCG-C06WGA-EpuloA1]
MYEINNNVEFLEERLEYVKEARALFLEISVETFKNKRFKKILTASTNRILRLEERFESIVKEYGIESVEFLPQIEEE